MQPGAEVGLSIEAILTAPQPSIEARPARLSRAF
jgi:hypothetical protein